MMIKNIIKTIYHFFIKNIAVFRPIYETKDTVSPISITTFFIQKIIGINRKAYWPMHFTSYAGRIENILTGIGTAPGSSPGCYIQAYGPVYIGDYTIIAPNVGIISANHLFEDYREHVSTSVKIGKYCWIGMNSVILPNVEIGDHTIVGAGSVVTKSFPEGYCIIAGNPARVIKMLNKEECMDYKNEYEYYGYIPKQKFDQYRKKYLKV